MEKECGRLFFQAELCARTACASGVCELELRLVSLPSPRARGWGCGCAGRAGRWGRLEAVRSVWGDQAACTGIILGGRVGLSQEPGM